MYLDQRNKLSKIVSKAQFYTELKQYKAAKLLLENSINEYGETSHIYNQLGLIQYSRVKFLICYRIFQKGTISKYYYIEAAYNLLACYCDLSMYEEAEELKNK